MKEILWGVFMGVAFGVTGAIMERCGVTSYQAYGLMGIFYGAVALGL